MALILIDIEDILILTVIIGEVDIFKHLEMVVIIGYGDIISLDQYMIL